MGIEIEAKMKVDDLGMVRKRLIRLRAKRRGVAREINTFFDKRKGTLRKSGKGLRIRVATKSRGEMRCTVTMKGPLKKGSLKSREEIEFIVDDPKAAKQLLEHLGYQATLSFEKRRESWEFRRCKIELDELPYLGKFVEIEGESTKRIMAVRKAMGLGDLDLIKTGYISMLARYVEEHHIKEHHLRLKR